MEIVVGEIVGVDSTRPLVGAASSQPPQNSARKAKEAQSGPSGTMAAKKTKSLQLKPLESGTTKSEFTGFVPSGQREHVGSAPGHSHNDAVWRTREQSSGSSSTEANNSNSRHVVFKYGMSLLALYVWSLSGQIVQEVSISAYEESQSSPWNPGRQIQNCSSLIG